LRELGLRAAASLTFQLRIEIFPGILVPTASAEAIVAMKILSATPQRPRDLGDIQAILRASPTLDHARISTLLELITARDYSRGQDLVEKWRRLRVELGT
jgi:hypothetical protein